ncbi:MAG: LysM peptidoglycan-binding domain-containing protein [Planctomycetaceae bacterium]|nr:LysM peptidoglycan-binding domain-containing protein [Planctomycetaceae bacterium]
MEAIKPLVVLVLFGTILYGAYSVVQKGPTAAVEGTAASEAPPFAAAPAAAPQVELPAAPPPFEPAPVVAAPPVAAPVAPATPAFAPPQVPPPPFVAQVPAVTPAAAGGPLSAPIAGRAAAAVAATAAAGATVAAVADQPPTYLNPQSSMPPAADEIRVSADSATRPDRYATLPMPGLPAAVPPPATVPAPAPRSGSASSAAFATAWTDAHEKLTAGRYAEALAGLSVWYDDPSLGLEESQRLEDLLGQLAGTVIYSQQDLLLPPHVVAPDETLATIAATLGVGPQLLAKINGISDPLRLVPGDGGNYAGSFPVLVGRQYLARVGGALPVVDVSRGAAAPAGAATLRRSIVLGEGLVIEAVDDPTAVSDNVPQSSLIVSVRDLDELIDILGPGSRVLVRQ